MKLTEQQKGYLIGGVIFFMFLAIVIGAALSGAPIVGPLP